MNFSVRANKLTKIIDDKLGPSAAEAHRFDVALLEKQALRFLKLEDEQAEKNHVSPTSHVTYFQTIIAACCYI